MIRSPILSGRTPPDFGNTFTSSREGNTGKNSRRSRPGQAAANVACFYVFVSLLPVNGSIYSEDFLSRDSFSHQHGWRFICA